MKPNAATRREFFLQTAAGAGAAILAGGCATTRKQSMLSTNEMTLRTPGGARLELGPPIPVALSEPGLTDWGYHQFMSLSPYPGGKILCRYSGGADAITAYGLPQPTFISEDGGISWAPHEAPGLPNTGIVGEMYEGEFVCMPPMPPINVREMGLDLPEPLNDPEDPFIFFRVDQCPPEVQNYFSHIDGARWTPATQEWRPERLELDMEGALAWSRTKKKWYGLLSNMWFEGVPVRKDGAILSASYRRMYLTPEGGAPAHLSTLCMASEDNGHSWHNRAYVAITREIDKAYLEPEFGIAANGDVLCAIRPSGYDSAMHLSRSNDAGHTWSPVEPLIEYGVLPCLLGLECGAVVLSYGRPGVKISFSPGGNGEQWAPPLQVLPGTLDSITQYTDGYTRMAATGPDTFLLGYTDFEWRTGDGEQCKAVIVRQGRVIL